MDGEHNSTIFTDSSARNLVVNRNGNAVTSTAEKKFGGASAYFDGASELRVPGNLAEIPSSMDFTIEAWVYPIDTGNFGIFGSVDIDTLAFAIAGDSLGLDRANRGGGAYASGSITPNVWQHVAAVRLGNTARLFVNGIQRAEFDFPYEFIAPGLLGVGHLAGESGWWTNGYIDEFRVTKGLARYPGNFVAPTAPFSLYTGCYANGFNTGGVNFAGTGWCITNERYYIKGEETSLSQAGTGVHNGKSYLEGQLLNGVLDGVCYEDGVNTGTYGAGNGSCKGLYYIGGVVQTGLDSTGTGLNTIDGKSYVGGSPVNGAFQDRTTLLLHMEGGNNSQTFTDSSTKNHSVTATWWSPSLTTGERKFGNTSAYFNGGGSISVANATSNLSFSGAFTIEAWVNFEEVNNNAFVVYSAQENWGTPNYGFGFVRDDGRGINGISFFYGIYGSNTVALHSNYVPTAGQWGHYAVTRDSQGVWRIFVNGAQVPHSVREENTSFDPNYNIQANSENYLGHQLKGYLDEVRITKDLARYTSDFTLPDSEFTTIPSGYYFAGVLQPGLDSNGTGFNALDSKYYVNGSPAIGFLSDATALLLRMDGGDWNYNFSDSSSFQHSISSPNWWNTYQTSSQLKFGNSSGYFNGGGYLSTNNSSALAVGSGDFTIEAWVHPTQINYSSDLAAVIDTRAYGGSTGVMLWLDSSTGKWVGYLSTNGNSTQLVVESSSQANLNAWSHLALVRSGQSFMLFVDGEHSGSAWLDSSWALSQESSPRFLIGTAADSPGYTRNFYGYIDELRFTRGQARYTASFNPPSVAFQSPITGYYADGVLKPGLDDMGSGCISDICYVGGALATGYVNTPTTLLLNMDGQNYSQNFIDSSNPSRSPTISGSPQIRTEDSKFGGASAYFDGYGSSLFFASDSDFTFGSGDFTMELWYKKTGSGPNSWEQSLIATADPQDYYGVFLGIYSNNPQVLLGYGYEWAFRLNPIAASEYEWHHLAATRSNGTVYLFIDGNLAGTTSDWTNLTNANNGITVGGRSVGSQYFQGYIDDVRVTKGLARYTSSFTPPQTAFSEVPKGYYVQGVRQPGLDVNGTGLNALDNKYYVNGSLGSGYFSDNNTVLLLHMDGSNETTSFNDASLRNQSVSVVGDAKVSTAQSKFGGGSLYLDGEDDRLDISMSGDFNLEGGDYTVEFFANIQDTSGWDYPRLFTIENGEESWGVILHTDGSYGVSVNHYGFGEGFTANGVLSGKVGSWVHFALVRSGQTRTLYIDGVNAGSTSSRVLPRGDAQLSIGGSTIAYPYTRLHAYIDEFRVTKGLARYTSNFTPPETAFSSWDYYIQGVLQPGLNSNGTGMNSLDNRYYLNGSPANAYVADDTVLLLNFEGVDGSTSVTDSSGRNHSVSTYESPQISSANFKFGGSSLALDGASCLEVSPNSDFKLGNLDFTVETWAYVTGGTPTIMRLDAGDGTGEGLLFGHGQPLTVGASTQKDVWNILSGNPATLTDMALNQWKHVAITRKGNIWKGFVDGVEQFSTTATGPLYQSSGAPTVRIGAANSGCGYAMSGYLDDVRITKGRAIYASNFTPATAAAGKSGVCYVDGYDVGTINAVGTGWCSSTNMFYVSGAGVPGLDSSGTGLGSDGRHYVNGVPVP
jgi:hypothetical protein